MACHLWPFEVPDISPNHGDTDAITMAARTLAASLSLEEVAKRTAASTVLAFILAWAVKVILVKVTNSFSGVSSRRPTSKSCYQHKMTNCSTIRVCVGGIISCSFVQWVCAFEDFRNRPQNCHLGGRTPNHKSTHRR